MPDIQASSAQPGYYFAYLKFDKNKSEYCIRWFPIVAWALNYKDSAAFPCAAGKKNGWNDVHEFSGLVAAPDGRFYLYNNVYLSLDEWVHVCIECYEQESGRKLGFNAWREVDPMPLPFSTAAPVSDDCVFDPKAFRPGMKGSAKKRAGKTTVTAASIFE